MKLVAAHHPALAPYTDFTFALATPPPTPSPLRSSPAVTYHVVRPSTVRSVGDLVRPRVFFTTFILDRGALSVTRADLTHVLDLVLTRYADAADLVAEVTKTMAEPLGKPDAAWCLEIHASVKDVARRRLEMARTYSRELMRLADLERCGHVPRSWKTFSRPGAKRAARKRRSMQPSLSEDELPESPTTSGASTPSPPTSPPATPAPAAPEASLSPLQRPCALLRVREEKDDTDWTGSMQCGRIHFVSEWVFRVTRLIVTEGFAGVQEERDAAALESARVDLGHLQRHMARTTPSASGSRSPPPPPYAPRGRTISLTSLSRFRSAPTPSPARTVSPPTEKLKPEKRKVQANKDKDKDARDAKGAKGGGKASKLDGGKDKAGVCDYLRRMFVG